MSVVLVCKITFEDKDGNADETIVEGNSLQEIVKDFPNWIKEIKVIAIKDIEEDKQNV